MDFQDFLTETPALDHEFSPTRELSKIRQAPRNEQKAALDTYKAKLIQQRKALARCRVFVERSIEFDPDVAKEKLDQWISKFSLRYGFAPEQKEIAERTVEEYYAARSRMLTLRAQIPDDHLLASELTGISVDKDVPLHVLIGPMTIDMITDAHTASKMLVRSETADNVNGLGGLAGESEKYPGIYYTVLKKSQPFRRRNLAHERQHITNRLFRPFFDRKTIAAENKVLWDRYEQEEDGDIKRELLEEFLGEARGLALNKAKDEIFAMKREGGLKGSPLLNLSRDILIRHGGLYDYLAPWRNFTPEKDAPLYREVANKILGKEYVKIIEKALEAFDILLKSSYATDEVIALLTDKTLPEWPKTARRLTEGKEKHYA